MQDSDTDASGIVRAHVYRQWIARAVRGLSDEAVFQVRQEMDQHVIARAEAFVASGIDLDQAVWQAVVELGPAERANRHYRRVHITIADQKVLDGITIPTLRVVVVFWLWSALLAALWWGRGVSFEIPYTPAFVGIFSLDALVRYRVRQSRRALLIVSIATTAATLGCCSCAALHSPNAIWGNIFLVLAAIFGIVWLIDVCRTIPLLSKLREKQGTEN